MLYRRKFVYSIMVSFALIILYSLFELDKHGGLMERKELEIKMMLWGAVFVSGVMLCYSHIIDRKISAKDKAIGVSLSLLFVMVSFVVMLGVYGFRHGVGF